ncbi:TPA: hypothetical protein NGR31_000781 [Vibrio parahaemolyticus]|uniref:hypothetical protein n=1 Tax=Vibrio rotiferianus TaxID=190895 RepID=UPI0015F4213D|nr:hypothetical protein [Vibrio rotiferianus]HCE1548235.1 hypothetical protein [Vibrio parahaemolyticus]HCG5573025.1 hypothetical protein [Vibrio parahaemolyticus]HCH1025119.1 hypothetical protein [Vibrio parahaemolyticus]HCH5915832.1 hypothetical protein [Vibrio parahaemolyticus]
MKLSEKHFINSIESFDFDAIVKSLKDEYKKNLEQNSSDFKERPLVFFCPLEIYIQNKNKKIDFYVKEWMRQAKILQEFLTLNPTALLIDLGLLATLPYEFEKKFSKTLSLDNKLKLSAEFNYEDIIRNMLDVYDFSEVQDEYLKLIESSEVSLSSKLASFSSRLELYLDALKVKLIQGVESNDDEKLKELEIENKLSLIQINHLHEELEYYYSKSRSSINTEAASFPTSNDIVINDMFKDSLELINKSS